MTPRRSNGISADIKVQERDFVRVVERRCPYCGEVKPFDEFSKEHVIPRALGGNLEPDNPFLIECCGRCNNVCGRWVDAPFVRNWFVHNARALAARHFVSPNRDPILPLLYMGEIDNWGEEERVCDFYLGPGGDHIYHIHLPYQDDPVLAGGPPARPGERDAGLVVVGIVTTNPKLHPILVHSVRAAFKGASLHQLIKKPDGALGLAPAPKGEDDLVGRLPLHSDPSRKLRFSVDINFGDRFLVKLGLGVGTALFGERFAESVGAQNLRKALWTRETDEWPDSLRGTSFLVRSDPNFTRLLNWNGCHFLGVQRHGDGIGLTFAAYGKYPATILMDDSDHYGVDGRDGMLIWVIAPGLRRYAGPMSLFEYVGARLGDTRGPLATLQRHVDAAFELPPAPSAEQQPR